ncbi:type II secretion system minor pseudopilin GspI [Parvularcula maris]|uniref:Type II secretion system protein I n=1 Tax=Parvularcula maris TaxID=2965077 RepID=A0A9X2L8H1_9PROT|nr:type II secretion system minor pseudopilin GspI [Parvularcula maris]
MSDQRGLTLIEVLVAMTVLALVVGSLLVLIGQHTRQAAALEDRLMARIAADNALASYIIAREEGARVDLRSEEEIGGRTIYIEIGRSNAPLEGFELVEASARLSRDGQVLASYQTIRPVGGLAP